MQLVRVPLAYSSEKVKGVGKDGTDDGDSNHQKMRAHTMFL